jgi:hypothetical protein
VPAGLPGVYLGAQMRSNPEQTSTYLKSATANAVELSQGMQEISPASITTLVS